MRGLISYLYPVFLSAASWIAMMLVASFVVKSLQRKRLLRITALVTFVVFSSPAVKNVFDHYWQPPRAVIAPGKVYSCGIVLGGFASIDADNTAYFNQSADRFIQVLRLYKTGNLKTIIVSGGNGKNENKSFGEGIFTRQELEVMGVPDSVVFVEDNSANTFDNAVNARKIIDSLRLPPPYLLVTSAVHMPRAALLFRQSGLQVDKCVSSYSGALKPFGFMMLVPSMEVLLSWNACLKEIAGYWWYK